MTAIDQKTAQSEDRPNPSMGTTGHQQLKAGLSSLIPFALRELETSDRRLPSYLFHGPPGCGKGMIVDQLYKDLCKSAGHDLPYEIVECNNLLHTELFGIEKKVATDVNPSLGRIAQAEGGLIHFDEIGKPTSKITDQILIWMERGHFHRPGNEKRQTSRAIAVFTMSENPHDLVRDGKWGVDFLNRFRNIIQIPNLAENIVDIMQYANTFAESFLNTHSNGDHFKVEFSDELRTRIEKYNWPGNIRELENTVDRWLTEVIIEAGSVPQSTLILNEDLFDKYPPPLKSYSENTLAKYPDNSLKDSEQKTKDKKPSIPQEAVDSIIPFTLPPGIEWKQLAIGFAEDSCIFDINDVFKKHPSEIRTFEEMCFQNLKSKRNSIRPYNEVLGKLADNKGKISYTKNDAKLIENIAIVNKRLQYFFRIKENLIECNRDGGYYYSRFKIHKRSDI